MSVRWDNELLGGISCTCICFLSQVCYVIRGKGDALATAKELLIYIDVRMARVHHLLYLYFSCICRIKWMPQTVSLCQHLQGKLSIWYCSTHLSLSMQQCRQYALSDWLMACSSLAADFVHYKSMIISFISLLASEWV